ncbi:MAG: L,D-transpeptidase family protein [Candidatus Omnitrophica bacterium]|nr:L,D-transpeptidase family protein [Candidatus Omnitrophota bacterium]
MNQRRKNLIRLLVAGLLMLAGVLYTVYAETGTDTLSSSNNNSIPQQLFITGENIIHTVKPDESLFNIARIYGVSYPAIARANGIDNPNLIFPEQKLVIPLNVIVPKTTERGILINVPEFRMYVFNNRMLAGVYPICIGLVTWQTPLGEFMIVDKVRDPAWYMPLEIAEREKVKREIIPAGPDNPLGDRWIGTSVRHTGIHGTNQPMSIGKALSHGCVRLYPEDIHKVFEEVAVGDTGAFIYEPVKIYAAEKEILIEVHPDIYSLISGVEALAREKLKELNLLDKINPEKLEEELKRISGIPVSIGR